jgi:hypothetical protein
MAAQNWNASSGFETVWVSTRYSGTVSVIGTRSGRVLHVIPVGTYVAVGNLDRWRGP